MHWLVVDLPVSISLLGAWGSWYYWGSKPGDWNKLSYGLQVGYWSVFLALGFVSVALGFLKKCLLAIGLVFGPFILIFVTVWGLLSGTVHLLSFLVVGTNYSHRGPDSAIECCRLCERCNAIVERSALLSGARWYFTQPVEQHQFHTKADLEVSARSCHMCAILWKSVDEFRELTEGSSDMEPDELTIRVSMKVEFMGLDDVGSQLNKRALTMELCGQSVGNAGVLVVNQNRSRGNSSHVCYKSLQTDSQDIYAWANRWTQSCSSAHDVCKNKFIPEASKHYLPLRLLDVGGREDDRISVKLSAQLDGHIAIDYLALSHCWGEAVNVTLCKSNIDEMVSFEINSLTKNFQDAVAITRGLKVRYLWIDSLCIVQDDNAEWEAESANMGLVYASAKCVISASASKDSNGGCFLPRELFRHQCTLRKWPNRSVTVSSCSKKNSQTSLKLFKDKAENTALDTRAWAFQERYLARRVLHFCEGVVFFECNTLVAWDGEHYSGEKYSVKAGVRADGTLHPPDDYTAVEQPVERYITRHQITAHQPSIWKQLWKARREVEIINPQYVEQQKQLAKILASSARSGIRGAFELLWRFAGSTLAEKVEFHQSWYEMVEKYSARRLTRQSDKLKAFHGIAYLVQENTALHYIAGLWKEMLVFNLLWIVESAAEERRIPEVPSWSWGSVNGRISHRLQIPQLSEESNGIAKSYRFQSSWKEIMPLISADVIDVREETNSLVLDATLWICGFLLPLTAHHVNVIYDTSLRPPSHVQLICLPVLAFSNAEVHPMGSRVQLHGLVLQSTSEYRDIYKRVGYFWTVESLPVEEILQGHRRASSIYLI
ncbi:heterokaryon incompatibility protein-domain-containing protein [Bisporella sp. PMI_857]|nr:heterokaryon incompatibility protein-domain-containing protein [Bisporella sp. PMI_857]